MCVRDHLIAVVVELLPQPLVVELHLRGVRVCVWMCAGVSTSMRMRMGVGDGVCVGLGAVMRVGGSVNGYGWRVHV